ncbi:MAG TPA: sigma-70 family RNA polymerase sigma factor, partial [Planctomycetota bacterium]|nr:sigma-70 family RNA polymerase sigma factor [Planctomycetota bacterium]
MTDHGPTSLLAQLGWLRALASQLARDPHRADDATQDTWAAALASGGVVARPRAWLAAVLRNCLRQQARGERARAQRQQQAARPEGTAGAAELVQRAETQRELVAAVLRLPAVHRDTVLLRFFDDLPPRVIAERLAVPIATVHSRLQRALQQLRAELDDRCGGRAAWLLALLPAPPVTVPLTPFVGLLMQAKLKVVAALLLAAGVCTWFWSADRQSSASAAPLARGSDGGDHAGSGAARSGNQSGGQPQRRELTAPAAAAPAAARVQVHGLVRDCVGSTVAGVVVGARGDETASATSDAAGRFTIAVLPGGALLEARDDRYVTVLGADWSANAGYEPLLVVALAARVAGIVVDEAGAPVAAARLALQLPDGFETRFPVPLDRAERLRWNVSSGDDGSFRLPRIPRLDGASLFVAAPAFRPSAVPLPPVDDDHLQVVLQRFHYEQGQLAGLVTDHANAPVAGALVAMGVTTVVSGPDGTFALSLRRAGWPTAIVAAKAGYRPARVEVPKGGGTRLEDWPARIVLQLGPKPMSAHGRVVDLDRHGVAGAEVWIADPTLLGIASVLPLQLEYLVAGGEVPPQAARMRVPHADEPTKDENFTDQVS